MTARRASAITAIAAIARGLGDDLRRVVFVGGTVPALYPLERGADVRPTEDVDCVVDVATTAAYYAFMQSLQPKGFGPCTDEGAPLCRLVYRGTRVDVVGTEPTGVGPTNRWYRDAMVEAASYRVAADLDVRAITPVYFVATKLEAFRGRGDGDYQASHDIEDALFVLAGLSDLRVQIARGSSVVERSVHRELATLGAKEAFVDAVRGHFEGDDAGQACATRVISWLQTLEA